MICAGHYFKLFKKRKFIKFDEEAKCCLNYGNLRQSGAFT
jgi:hypothetical protein